MQSYKKYFAIYYCLFIFFFKLKSEYNTFKEETETLLETSQYQSDLLSKKIEEQTIKLKEMEDLEKKLTVKKLD